MAHAIRKMIIRLRDSQAHPPQVTGTRGAAAPGCVPQREAHLRAGDRRCGGPHGGGGVVERKERRQDGGNVAGAKAIGKLVAERAKEKGIKQWCSTAAAICITAA